MLMKPGKINNGTALLILESLGKKARQWKHYLPIINLALLIGVAGLAIVCVLMVYFPPESALKPEKPTADGLAKKNPLLPLATDSKTVDAYELMLSNNPFSPDRNVWNPVQTKAAAKHEESAAPPAPAPQAVAQPPVVTPEKPKGPPKKITLRGIMVIGSTKKALIENPDPAKYKTPLIFIEEGEEVVEYKVKHIDEDQIRLDWYGDEQIFVMRSNIKK